MVLNKFLTFEKYIFVSDLSPAKVMALIASMIRSQKNPEGVYQGEIIDNTFKATRIIKNSGSFKPNISGKISPVLNKTEVSIIQSPPIASSIFLIVWTCIMGNGCLKVIFPSWYNLKIEDKPIWFLPFFMLFAGYLIALLPFKSESKRFRESLELLLEAKEVK